MTTSEYLGKYVLAALAAMVVAMLLWGTGGCTHVKQALDSGPVQVSVSARGGPAAVLNEMENAKMRSAAEFNSESDCGITKDPSTEPSLPPTERGVVPETSPGGITERPHDLYLVAIRNSREGVRQDVFLYTRQWQPDMPLDGWENWPYMPYRGPAEVLTPKGWLKVNGLEAIHFETPLVQSVTLRLRHEDGVVEEIRFDTFGRAENESTYRRINMLLIRLPRERFKLEVFSYEGVGIFKVARGWYTTYLDRLYRRPYPARYVVMGRIWVSDLIDLW